MGTNNGISRLNPRNGTFKNYSVADGLPGPDFTGWGDCFKSASGEMFFGGFAGAVAFHPEDVSDNAYTPPLVLTEFDLFGTPVRPGPHSPLERAIGYTDAVTLSYAQNTFSFEFSALSFPQPYNQSIPLHARGPGCELARGRERSAARELHDAAGGSL